MVKIMPVNRIATKVDLQLKRDSEVEIVCESGKLIINDVEAFS